MPSSDGHHMTTDDEVEAMVDDVHLPSSLPVPSDTSQRTQQDRPSRRPLVYIKIVSASYGPSEKVKDGLLASGDGDPSRTRDVTPFVRALLLQNQAAEREQRAVAKDNSCDSADVNMDPTIPSRNFEALNDCSLQVVCLTALSNAGMRRREFTLLEGISMNCIFGDPCPGISKRLHVQYMLSESAAGLGVTTAGGSSVVPVHVLSFAEHEPIVLRRRDEYYGAPQRATLQHISNDASDGGRTMAKGISDVGNNQVSHGHGLRDHRSITAQSQYTFTNVSEVLLPMVLPYLDVRERVQSQLVCKIWSNTVGHWGLATSIDSTDPSFPTFTRPILRGILANSYTSLQCLFLSGFVELEKEDLTEAIPYLSKLRYLDVSKCYNLDDDTLASLSHVADTLEVLYIKGLRLVTDTGMISLARSCTNLRALDISGVSYITDASGIEIGRNLSSLRALYLRDNFRLTSQSFDMITRNCRELEQLAFWGCIRFQRLYVNQISISKLRILNLWGCHGLGDEAANALEGMENLRTLIVAECHKLTDLFVETTCKHLPQLYHLNLCFCPLITDNAVNHVSQRMISLYSLNVSLCPKITVTSISDLFQLRGDTLVELSLMQCRRICQSFCATSGEHSDRSGSDIDASNADLSVCASTILQALRYHGHLSSLSVFDLRYETSLPSDAQGTFVNSFVQELASLGFEQKCCKGYFYRPARWNGDIAMRLVSQSLS